MVERGGDGGPCPLAPRGGHTPRRRHLAALGKRLPARSPGRGVCTRSATAALAPRGARALCRRRRLSLCAETGRGTCARRAAEAIRQVRADAASAEDAAGTFS